MKRGPMLPSAVQCAKKCLSGRDSTASGSEKNPSGKLDVSLLNQRHWRGDHSKGNLLEEHQQKSHPAAL